MRVDSALASIAGKIVIVKNNLGQIYWPEFDINTIGSMQSGKGYQIYLSASGTLKYPANAYPSTGTVLSKSAVIALSTALPETKHYRSAVSNTGSSAIVVFQTSSFKEGDEIGLWNSNHLLVGSGVMKNGKAIMTVWGDDILTVDVLEGALENE
jgi:hypothetical protein